MCLPIWREWLTSRCCHCCAAPRLHSRASDGACDAVRSGLCSTLGEDFCSAYAVGEAASTHPGCTLAAEKSTNEFR
eukprot:5824506-Prymnesium_polylepis.1